MAKNVQLYDYTGTTKLYPTTVAQEVIYNDEPLSNFLSDCVSVDNDHEQRIYTLEQKEDVDNDHEQRIYALEQKVGNGVASDEDFINLQEEVNNLDSRITTLENNGGGIPIIELTQAEYDSLDEYQFNTLYYITDGISVIDELMARVSALENP